MVNLNEKAIELITRLPEITDSVSYSRVTLDFYSNNAVMFKLDGNCIDWFFSKAKTRKEEIDTRHATRNKIIHKIENNCCCIDVDYSFNDLRLIQHFKIERDTDYFTAHITLIDRDITETNYLVPLDFCYPAAICDELFLSLKARMLLVPFDNDMWVYYESVPLKPGRKSYDVSVIYDPDSHKGLLLGALDFGCWKNAICCSPWDARSFYALSGIADDSSHDHLEHGWISDTEVDSSRFVCGFYPDVRDALQQYGLLAANTDPIYHWSHGVPFGWNSYSALTLYTTIEHMDATADFIYDDLNNFKTEENISFINFDAVFGINNDKIKILIDRLKKRGQKVGWYMNPLSHLPIQDQIPLKGNPTKFRRDILMKNEDGSNYPAIDGKYPIDISLPEAELDFRLTLREFAEMGFEYIKLDFLSHGCVEGKRYNKTLKTGRQALMYFYEIVREELAPEKAGRDIFVSSSIAPLFPCGFSHSRRASCDAFGHHEDVKYILNALTYAFWTNKTLYQFNDPDHIVLYSSMVDGRSPSSENEARSRYNASVISGTVMLLSDNYGPEGDSDIIKQSRKRAQQFANNPQLNEIARMNEAFRPLTMETTSNVYYLNGYLAVFNFKDTRQTFSIRAEDVKLTGSGILINIGSNDTLQYENIITIELDAYDSAIYKLKNGRQ